MFRFLVIIAIICAFIYFGYTIVASTRPAPQRANVTSPARR